jgi:hypothetical protein
MQLKLNRNLRTPELLFIAVNLIPIFGVWFEGWDPKQMFLVYCLETVIIGLYNIIKMLIVTLIKKKDVWENNGSRSMVSGFFFILFFIFHYGLFVFVQTSMFIGVSSFKDSALGSPFTFFFRLPSLLSPEAQLLLFIFIGVYGVQMMMDFIVSGTYKTISLGTLMFQPYLRIFIQQIVVIFGSMFLVFGAGKIFILIFVVIRIGFELFLPYDRILTKAALLQAKTKS